MPQGSKRIAVIGDQQRTSWIEFWKESNTAHAEVVQRVAEQKPDALILLGDQVFWSTSASDWRFFDDIMQPAHALNIPVFPLFGNHEYMGCGDAGIINMQSRFAAASMEWCEKIGPVGS